MAMTSAELDQDWNEFRTNTLQAEKKHRAKLFPDATDASAVTKKMDDLELKLRTLAGKGVMKWSLEGWKVEACKPDIAIQPIRAELHFRHKLHVGYDAAIAWGADQDTVVEWLEENGISLGEYNIEFV